MEYVINLEKIGVLGETWKYKCNFCKVVRTSSYSRVKAHLLHLDGQGAQKCKGVKYADKHETQRMEKDYEQRKKDHGPREVPLPGETRMDVDLSQKKRRFEQSPIARCFGIEARDQLDQEIARTFFNAGLPFNLAKNPHYMRAFIFAASHNIEGYKPPGYNKFRTTLAVQEITNIEKLLIPLKSTWKEKGRELFGEVTDKFFIANLMKEVILEVGHQNVVQFRTDNAANCKGSGELIESEFPHIYWTPCVVHTLNLALKNICAPRNVSSNEKTYEECSWINEVHGDAIQIKNFIMNNNMRLSMFQKYSPLKLLSVADTRFAFIVVMLKQFRLIKRGLQAMVISEEWVSYREEDIGKANFVKEKILNDDWWDKVAYIVDFTRPIYDMIRYCDTDLSTICFHLVYEMWDSMIEKVKLEIYKKEKRAHSDFSSFYQVVYDILVSRWAKNNTPLHCLARSLHPRLYSDECLVGDPTRVAPHRDGEISRERMKCFRRLFPGDYHSKVLDEFALFFMMSGPFEDLTCFGRMYSMDPKSWWANFGAQNPLLQSLAIKILGKPTSSSCSKQNWSTYAFIHSLRKNKLTPSRAQDLVFIHNNLRLLSRNSDQYLDESTKMWDVGGDAFDLMEDVGFLDFAELSLDELDFENYLVGED